MTQNNMPVFLIFFCVTGKIYGATLCDADVEVLIDGIPIEKNLFNVTFSFTNISKENLFHLVPSWDKLTVLQDTVLVDKSDNISVSMIAEYFYLYQVQLSCVNSQQEEEAALFDIPVGRTVIDSLLANIFQKLIFAGVVFTMFLLGCELNLETVRSYLAHPVGPVAGMVCQYVVMPVAAYVWGYIFLTDSLDARYGLIIVGCSPGGTFSNFYTAIWNGDVNLSVTMTFCSSVASFACTTFWIWLFGTFVLSADRDIQLPYLQLFLSLVSFVVPILLGLLLTYKKPTLGAKLAKICRPFFLGLIVIYTTLGIYANRFFIFVISWQHFVASACLGYSGYIIGIIIASILCLSRPQTIALSIETAMQNVNIAVAVLQFNLVSPYNDMALLPVIGYLLLCTGLPQLFSLAVWKIVSCIKNKKEKDQINNTAMAMDNKAFS